MISMCAKDHMLFHFLMITHKSTSQIKQSDHLVVSSVNLPNLLFLVSCVHTAALLQYEATNKKSPVK